MSKMNGKRANGDCESIRMLLEEYFEGTLSAGQEGHVSAHISWCHDCAAELSLISRMVAALEAVPTVEPAPQLLHAISARVAKLPAPAERRRLTVGWGKLALYAAVVAAATGVLSLAFPMVWGKYAYLGTPVIVFGHRALAAGGSLVTGLWEAISALSPMVKALGQALWVTLPRIAPTAAAYVAGELAMMAAIVMILRRVRRRAVRVPFLSLL